jgi:DNA-binding IclR family transcriptional regulator
MAAHRARKPAADGSSTGGAPQSGKEYAIKSSALEAPYGRRTGNLHRALEILEVFAVEQRPLSVGEVAERLGYPQSSTSVTLHSLVELGYLEQSSRSRTFLPSLRVVFLGMWMHQRILDEGSLLAIMQELASVSGNVVALGMENGLHVQYIHVVAVRPTRIGLKPGLLRPICRAAIGKVLLSLKSDAEVRRIVAHANAVETQYPAPVDPDSLVEELSECRRTGFAQSVDGVTSNSSVIAARLPVHVGGAPVGIGIAVPTPSLEALRPRLVALLRDTFAAYFDPSRKAVARPTVVAARGSPVGAGTAAAE